MADKKQVEVHLLPAGRLINSSLFEMDIYKPERGEEGKPSYKIELAFDPKDVTGEGTIEDHVIWALEDAFGATAQEDYFGGKVGSPFLDGNRLAAKREAKGKPGDAYKGKIIIRAHTVFNKFGMRGPGGIAVYDLDVSKIEGANQEKIYPGCFGQAAVTISTYTDSKTGYPSANFYLSAFQKTAEGEKLVTPRDHSTLFKPTGRVAPAEGAAVAGTVRRQRKG
jgi:hypothetical protein